MKRMICRTQTNEVPESMVSRLKSLLNKIADDCIGAPECYRGLPFQFPITKSVGQKCDIWSLGAVFSEVLVWTVGGWMALQLYRADRQVATDAIPGHTDRGCFHDRKDLLPCVVQTHNRLLKEIRKSDNITKPIVREILPNMLANHERGRLAASELAYRLDDLFRRLDHPQDQARTAQPESSLQATQMISQPSITGHEIASTSQVDALRTAFPQDAAGSAHQQAATVGISVEQTSPNSRTSQFQNGDSHGDRRPAPLTNDHGVLQNSSNNRTHQHSNGPRSKCSNLPMLSRQLVRDTMKNDKPLLLRLLGSKKHERLVGSIDEDESIRNLMRDRDHIFIVDNSATMKPHRHDVKTLLEELAWILMQFDDDGMDLYFTRSPDHINRKNPYELAHRIESIPMVGTSDINLRLSEVLEVYCEKLERWHNSKGKSKHRLSRLIDKVTSSEKPKPVSVYILTDGLWRQGTDALVSIRPVIEILQRYQLRSTEVGLQFIRFGDDPTGIATLNRLDSMMLLGFAM